MLRNFHTLTGCTLAATDGEIGKVREMYSGFVNLPRALIKDAPDYDPASPVSRAHEQRLHENYGREAVLEFCPRRRRGARHRHRDPFMKLIAICLGLSAMCGVPAPAVDFPPRERLPPTHLKTDAELQAAVVKGILVNPNVLAADLHVAVKSGAVTLTGTVRDAEAKRVAEKVTLSVPGVQSVKNLLTLRPAAKR